MVNAATQEQNFITKAEEQKFDNCDMVDETFTKNLLGDIVALSKKLCKIPKLGH